MIAVPTDAAADVEEDFVEVRQHRGDLVGDRFRGMEMAGVEAKELPLATA